MTQKTERKPVFWIGANWKMTKTRSEAEAYLSALLGAYRRSAESNLRLFVAPPYTLLAQARAHLAGSDVILAAQDVHHLDYGSATGSISPPMLTDQGVSLVILGHSERRASKLDDDESVGRKVKSALEHQLTALICVGENKNERDDVNAEICLRRQIKGALSLITNEKLRDEAQKRLLFAYEPVWAIGDGATPAEPDYVAKRHQLIKNLTREYLGVFSPCLYGGSVNFNNCHHFARHELINGLLIGRASWDASALGAIIERIRASSCSEQS